MNEYADYDLDKIDPEEIRKLRQYIPENEETEISSLAREAMQAELNPTETARKAGDFAKSFVGAETVYHTGGGRQEDNPLLGEPPYKLDNASFVYWCYHQAGLELRGGKTGHTIQTIKNDRNMITIGRTGSNMGYEDMAYGDIIFFNGDKHVGIYIGDGEFISFNGTGYNNYSGGLRVSSLKRGKWLRFFQGHILRHREEE